MKDKIIWFSKVALANRNYKLIISLPISQLWGDAYSKNKFQEVNSNTKKHIHALTSLQKQTARAVSQTQLFNEQVTFMQHAFKDIFEEGGRRRHFPYTITHIFKTGDTAVKKKFTPGPTNSFAGTMSPPPSSLINFSQISS